MVLIPDADAVVAPHRLRHDPAAAAGVPAHVTILYPFRPAVDETAARVVAQIAAGIPAFDVAFARLEHFPGGVVYLAPDPAAPFRRLISATMAAFPDCPPYGGTVPDPVPHLTIADGVDEATATALGRAVRPGLPITTTAERVTLIAQDPAGRWHVQRHWALG